MKAKDYVVTDYFPTSKARDIAMGFAPPKPAKKIRPSRVKPANFSITKNYKTARERDKWLQKQEGV